ncbi:MAG TPA: (2Fe-2S) ferredoxin domain-containing protein [Bacteroidota bacterium]|nr:(2Fe-2S) ferredoxin domain-containing protein [Bacteroidota bacterium]
MPRFERHVFVCTNERPAGHPKGCCREKGSEEIRAAMKSELKRRGVSDIVRANASGCLDACEFGPSVVIYPEAIWYGGVTLGDVPEIVDRTVLNGEVIERLLIRDPRYAPSQKQYSILPIPPKRA